MSQPNKQTTAALKKCLDILLRMIPDYCTDAGAEPCTDRQHDRAIAAAARALYGTEDSSWPVAVRKAARGLYD